MFFFFNDTATTEIYTLSLHDALPISMKSCVRSNLVGADAVMGHQEPARQALVDRVDPIAAGRPRHLAHQRQRRSEEHTSELQSRQYLVCRLLLEKKNNNSNLNGQLPL